MSIEEVTTTIAYEMSILNRKVRELESECAQKEAEIVRMQGIISEYESRASEEAREEELKKEDEERLANEAMASLCYDAKAGEKIVISSGRGLVFVNGYVMQAKGDAVVCKNGVKCLKCHLIEEDGSRKRGCGSVIGLSSDKYTWAKADDDTPLTYHKKVVVGKHKLRGSNYEVEDVIFEHYNLLKI